MRIVDWLGTAETAPESLSGLCAFESHRGHLPAFWGSRVAWSGVTRWEAGCMGLPAPPTKHLHEGANDMNEEWTLEDVLALADKIGERIDAGRLPRQDANGRYIFGDDDLALR